MPYVPQSPEMFKAAFSGACAGMGASDRLPVFTDSADYDGLTNVAGAFSQSFDTEWGALDLPATDLSVKMAQELCEVAWQNRSPVNSAPANEVSNYTPLTQALVAIIKSGLDYFAAQGISPNGNEGCCNECKELTAITTVDGPTAELKDSNGNNLLLEDGYAYILKGSIAGASYNNPAVSIIEEFVAELNTNGGNITIVGKTTVAGDNNLALNSSGLELIATVDGASSNWKACFEWVKASHTPPPEEA